MNVKVDQDALCAYCKDCEIANPATCEGRHCEEAQTSYLESLDLVIDPPKTFGDLRVGDTLYVIYDRKFYCEKVTRLDRTAENINFGCGNIAYGPLPLGDDDVSVNKCQCFVHKAEALERYEALMLVCIKEMAMTIAEHQEPK